MMPPPRVQLNGPVPSIEERVAEVEERQKTLEAAAFDAMGQLTAEVSRAASAAKSAADTSALVAAQFHAIHGEVQVAKSDMERVQRDVEEMRKSAYRSSFSSHHDVEGSEKIAALTAEQATRALELRIAEKAAAKAEADAEKAAERDRERGRYWVRYAVGTIVLICTGGAGALLMLGLQKILGH